MDEHSDDPWICYDAGPRSVNCPLIFLPPVCGSADAFYKQLLSLSSKGYRVISVSARFRLTPNILLELTVIVIS